MLRSLARTAGDTISTDHSGLHSTNAERPAAEGIVKLSEVGAVANHISLMRHI